MKHNVIARNQKRSELAVERSIRCAEIVRVLVALSEEVVALANGAPTLKIRAAALDLEVDLDRTSGVGAVLAQCYAERALQLYGGTPCLATRAAVLSAQAARSLATSRSKRMNPGA